LTVDEYLAQYDTALASLWPTVTLLPGALKLVQHLHEHGVPLAIATGSRRKNYLAKTQHLPALFTLFADRVVCGDDLRKGMSGKPAPDIFLLAAREILGFSVGDANCSCTEGERVEREKGLVFEDGISGLQGARRAGMSGTLSLWPLQ
jgi:pseudouridine 5'-phosphatase